MSVFLKRRVAYRGEFAEMCVAVQLNYLHCGCCQGLKPDADKVRTLDKKVRQQWKPGRTDYFDPTWLKSEFHYTQARSATFGIDPKNPMETIETAIANLDFNKPTPPIEWDFNKKKLFTGMIVVHNPSTKESHAIGIRKKHKDYFLHDVLTEIDTPTSIDHLECMEAHSKTQQDFETAVCSLLKAYTKQGFSQLMVLELTPTTRTISHSGIKWLDSLAPTLSAIAKFTCQLAGTTD